MKILRQRVWLVDRGTEKSNRWAGRMRCETFFPLKLIGCTPKKQRGADHEGREMWQLRARQVTRRGNEDDATEPEVAAAECIEL